jgi:hypothetical protein
MARVPTTWERRSESSAGACRRSNWSMSALPVTCASACSTTCIAAPRSRWARYGYRNTASSPATWWYRPTSTWSCQAAAWHGLFVFDPSLVFLVVDNMFGGDGRFHTRVEGRDFTATEQRIIQGLLGVLTFEYIRSEMNSQFANIATPSEIVVATTFRWNSAARTRTCTSASHTR